MAGMVEGKIPLTAPISGKPCFYFRTAVWRKEESAKETSPGNAGWKLVAEESLAKPFILNDATGRILVDPVGAEMDWPHDTYEEYGKTLLSTHTDVPAALEEFLARHKVKAGAAVRVEEYLIGPGAEVYVRGLKCGNLEFRSPAEAQTQTEKSSRNKDVRIAPKVSGTKIVRLSPEAQPVPAREMSMQSRVAAALTLARANAAAKTSEPIVIPGVTVAVVSEGSGSLSSQSGTALLQQSEMQNGTRAEGQAKVPADSGANSLQPAFIVRKPLDGSAFTISHRLGSDSDLPSPVRAVTLLLGGPLIALASIGELLARFGLF